MGTWGVGIEANDVALDVKAAFEDRLKAGDNLATASEYVLREFAALLEDEDEAPVVWLTLAKAQWTYGALAPEVLEQVRNIISSGRGLALWQEAGEKLLNQRMNRLVHFLKTIETPNARPKRLPHLIIRKPIFAPGDCLSVALPNGEYGAALVLVANHENPEHGMNLIGILDYMKPAQPDLAVFSRRRWLKHAHPFRQGQPYLAWYFSFGFRKVRESLVLIGNIPLRSRDPKESHFYGTWAHFGEQIVREKGLKNQATEPPKLIQKIRDTLNK